MVIKLKTRSIAVLQFLFTLLFVFTLIIIDVDWHSYKFYLLCAMSLLWSFALYMIGLKNNNGILASKKIDTGKDLAKQCVNCFLFFPFKDDNMFNHSCKAEKIQGHKV